jgi:hypothetical protein
MMKAPISFSRVLSGALLCAYCDNVALPARSSSARALIAYAVSGDVPRRNVLLLIVSISLRPDLIQQIAIPHC